MVGCAYLINALNFNHLIFLKSLKQKSHVFIGKNNAQPHKNK
jgi:hypothetical protein